MIVYRFMSKREFDKFNNGEVLVNNTDHSKFSGTTSKGFCFMNENDDGPEKAFKYLFGLVSTDVCVVFETEEQLTKCHGIYSDKESFDFFATCVKTEYCTNSYSNKSFKLLRYAENVWYRKPFKWKKV